MDKDRGFDHLDRPHAGANGDHNSADTYESENENDQIDVEDCDDGDEDDDGQDDDEDDDENTDDGDDGDEDKEASPVPTVARPSPQLPRLNMELLANNNRSHKYLEATTAVDAGVAGAASATAGPPRASRRSSTMELVLVRLGIEPQNQKDFMMTLLRYLIFLLLVTIALTGRSTDNIPFSWASTMEARFAPAQNFFEADGTLRPALKSVQSVDMLWRYLQNTFVAALRPMDTSYSDLGPIDGATILGSINIHQERVLALTCINTDPSCIPTQIDPLQPSSDPYGPGGVFQSNDLPDADICRWFWKQHDIVGADFSALLAPDPVIVSRRLEQLRNQSWIDIQTAVIYVDLAVYNPQIDLLCAINLVFEMPSTGGVRAHGHFRAVDIFMYSTTLDYVVTVFEIAALLMSIDAGWRAIRGHCNRSLFRDAWLLMDIAIMLMAILLGGLRFMTGMLVPELRQRTGEKPYTEWQSFAYTTQQLRKLAAILALFVWLKILKYLLMVSSGLRNLEETLVAARGRVLAYALTVILVILGFSQAFFMAFHNSIDGFRSLSHTLITLLGAMLHGYDITEIQKENWALGPLLYLIFAMSGALVLTHMFLAIVQAAYQQVNKLDNEDHRSKQVSNAIKATIDEVVRSNITITTPTLHHLLETARSTSRTQAPQQHTRSGTMDRLVLPGQITDSSKADGSATPRTPSF